MPTNKNLMLSKALSGEKPKVLRDLLKKRTERTNAVGEALFGNPSPKPKKKKEAGTK